MKKIIRAFVVNILIFWLLGLFVASLNIQANPKEVLTIAFIFTLLEQVVLPILSILFTPIHLLSFGLLKWVPMFLTIIILYFVSSFSIEPITIPHIQLFAISIPMIHLGQTSSFIFVTFLLLGLKRLFDWIFKG